MLIADRRDHCIHKLSLQNLKPAVFLGDCGVYGSWDNHRLAHPAYIQKDCRDNKLKLLIYLDWDRYRHAVRYDVIEQTGVSVDLSLSNGHVNYTSITPWCIGPPDSYTFQVNLPQQPNTVLQYLGVAWLGENPTFAQNGNLLTDDGIRIQPLIVHDAAEIGSQFDMTASFVNELAKKQILVVSNVEKTISVVSSTAYHLDSKDVSPTAARYIPVTAGFPCGQVAFRSFPGIPSTTCAYICSKFKSCYGFTVSIGDSQNRCDLYNRETWGWNPTENSIANVVCFVNKVVY